MSDRDEANVLAPAHVLEGRPAEHTVRAAFEAQSHAEDVVKMRRILTYALVAWISNAAFDAIGVAWLGRGRLAVLLGLRFAAAIAFGAVLLRLHLPPIPSVRLYRALNFVPTIGACAAMALMTVEQGTIASVYAHGVSVVLVAHGFAFQDPWRRGIVRVVIPALTYPVVLIAAAFFSTEIAGDFARPASLATFVQNGILVTVAASFVVAGGDVFHRLGREAFSQRGLGRYQLRERIARGGMGEIWRAHHLALDREVAVKLVRPERSHDPSAGARFTREVRVLAELRHPSIVRIFDYGVDPAGLRYFAMELLQGESLDARLQRERKLDTARAASIAHDVARALAEAHLKGIVHRDVTPQNVFIVRLDTGEELVKVLDFGIAKPKVLGGESATLTGVGSVIGTPTYMAPEQARGNVVDARTDIYALGVVLYRMLCGQPPFSKASNVEMLRAHVWEQPPKPSLLADVPPELENIVMRCLRKLPDERYPDATSLADALAAFAGRARAAADALDQVRLDARDGESGEDVRPGVETTTAEETLRAETTSKAS